MRLIKYCVTEEFDGVTAAVFLKSHGYSRRMMSNLKASGGLTLRGEILRTIDPVHTGDVVEILTEDEPTMTPNPNLNAELCYDDEDVAVFSKPPFMPVHPSVTHHEDTLGNLFTAMFPDTVFRPVYRLDCNTSGLCVCAKTRQAAAVLAKAVDKVYYAIVKGDMGSGEINLPIGRTVDSIIMRKIDPNGKPAATLYETVKWENGNSLVKIKLLTGRTHQIRVHFSHLGFPLLGDDLYGGDLSRINRHALHCGEVRFTHPVTGEEITVKSDLPKDMKALIEKV